MSQDYNNHGIFNFSNEFERSAQQIQQQQHMAQQIRRDIIEDDGSGQIPVYEPAGMLSEMFNFPPTPQQQSINMEWSYDNNRSMDMMDSKNHHLHNQNHSAMQLFLTNPQPRSPSPPLQPPHIPPSSSTLHMLLPNPSSSTTLEEFPSQFNKYGQGLSLSLSSSLQHFEAAKAEEFRMVDGTFFNQGPSSSSHQYPYNKNLHQNQSIMNFQTGSVVGHHHQLGFGSSSIGVVNIMRNSKYVKPAQEILEEFCSVGRGHQYFKKSKFINPNSNSSSSFAAAAGGSSSSSKDHPPLSAADRIEHQRRKVKLLTMLDEVDRRYNHYCEQMQTVVNSFDLVMGFGAAVPYTALAQKAMSRHFRCLKDAISAQLKLSYELLGEKDGAGISGVTKGETPRLKMLEQSLRQQRAFHQMGMMEQEAWRPQRGLPERSVNILRAWLFEHFLHPYPNDADKHLLARQTGLSRNQVANWFINARVRLWKPMVEDMYQQESKEEDQDQDLDDDHHHVQAEAPTTNTAPPCKRSEIINAPESDPSSEIALNRHYCLSENQAQPNFGSDPVHQNGLDVDDTCLRGSMVNEDDDHYGTSSAGIGSTTVIRRFGTTAGDVSLTLGLRHAGNMAGDKPFFR